MDQNKEVSFALDIRNASVSDIAGENSIESSDPFSASAFASVAPVVDMPLSQSIESNVNSDVNVSKEINDDPFGEVSSINTNFASGTSFEFSDPFGSSSVASNPNPTFPDLSAFSGSIVLKDESAAAVAVDPFGSSSDDPFGGSVNTDDPFGSSVSAELVTDSLFAESSLEEDPFKAVVGDVYGDPFGSAAPDIDPFASSDSSSFDAPFPVSFDSAGTAGTTVPFEAFAAFDSSSSDPFA